MQKYRLEFILHSQDASAQAVKNSLSEFGEDLKVTDCHGVNDKDKNVKVYINTDDPTTVFDICAQFGRIKTIKINEERRP